MGLSKVLSSTGIDEKCLTWHEWYERLPVHLLVPVPFHYNRISQRQKLTSRPRTNKLTKRPS